MVKQLIFLLLMGSSFVFSGEFTAKVNRNQVNMGDSFSLTLTLKDASPKDVPSVEGLNKSFFINSQNQSTSTVIVNGQVTQSIVWKLILLPQMEGDLIIPALTIQTSQGPLSTEPITIHASQLPPGDKSDPLDQKDVIVSMVLSNSKPYKNEPVIYKIKLLSRHDMANIKFDKFNVDDAIVEMRGEPKKYEKAIDGVRIIFLEFEYLITPLKAGPLKIPANVIQGAILEGRKRGSFFDDDFDPFVMMGGFAQLKPFALSTEEVLIDVQPAVPSVSPWLPAKSLKIEEVWNDSQLLQVGEPITRSLKLMGEGIKSAQLPNINDLQTYNAHFKVYLDNPELGDGSTENGITSFRTEHYTLMPQQAGELKLPEIKVDWWDTTKNEKMTAVVPARTIQVMPAPETNRVNQVALADEATLPVAEPQKIVVDANPYLYGLIAGLAALLFIVIFWAISLKRKNVHLAGKTTVIQKTEKQKIKGFNPFAESEKLHKVKVDKKEKLPDLNPT